ncbi:MAG: methylenetetrahydrofolate--tRNA-(uracil(54)-C(5))-methyltransferase (FADH(2)-oxidizing) TrmFO [Acidobacteria bacterium]|nr:methylenetetrahydrofolate--tRNA-(uracil(54)-C(5))-methyltransferase (FADH(2)-oxidizing) TrmFO [Acidobacteriota bacterium]MCI0622423.1 methylenetetrahydrofolate--tRNA-(uracil(54)-C(5))-methyltransferase (FADH(2)-oxidizing) TrmFO [Acidobacteriota bacterium]MCI0723430.1 methylenetetrahydrofolate--tRNA-(uracil(54)-C(5))-methyltransferase (FADH(2)-oxidizing) TrmFO [Acidobacteriota bacterium]
MKRDEIIVAGGGLAGSEAAWQIAQSGFRVRLYEMRPVKPTPAHQTDALAEIVCSNSFKSDQEGSAPWLLKEELKILDSLLIRLAYAHRVPSGASLSVDRERFAAAVTQTVSGHPNIEILRQELQSIPQDAIAIIATGPLTSDSLSKSIRNFAGEEHLYFYDAISPIVDADSIDMGKAYRASRYDKGDPDFINCPFTKVEYLAFYNALIQAESVPLHPCEKAMYFEACLPIEEMARRGVDTLRFGPMKPVGLADPRTGRIPYAAVQLRQENLRADSFNLVGFQNHLRFGEQERVFRLIPGLEQAKFPRLGQIHRNTFINSPRILEPTLQARQDENIFFAGQISGVEGYVECIATGLLAGLNAVRRAACETLLVPPRTTAIGSLIHYLVSADPEGFQPENINFGIMPAPEVPRPGRRIGKKEKHLLQTRRALEDMAGFKALFQMRTSRATG